jgi:hypothetical protein
MMPMDARRCGGLANISAEQPQDDLQEALKRLTTRNPLHTEAALQADVRRVAAHRWVEFR